MRRNVFRSISLILCSCILLTSDASLCQAQSDEATVDDVVVTEAAEAASAEPTIANLQADIDAAKLAGHNAWMLTCCALVLFMTAPGLALFYGGLVRRKNVLSVMMQCIFLMGLMTVIWALYGYTLAFGGTPGENYVSHLIGNGEFLMMDNVSRFWNEETGAPETPMEGAIPRLTHMLFQGMFFIITPALICGAFAERMKFSAMVVYSVLWGTFIYCPLTHWVWDGGILAYGGDNAIMGGALDFAGGTVVHISSGISALVAAILIGPRMGFGKQPLPPHNLTFTAVGSAMLWFGWFGFNAGSELASDELTSSAFAVTHFSAAAGAVAWAVCEWVLRGKPTVLGASSGAVAGLVCITPAAGFVQPMPSLIMGAIAGVVCYWSCVKLKNIFKYDDALDAFGVHGVGGTVGAILTGIFATRACWDIGEGAKLGLLEGGDILAGQIAAVIVTYLFAGIGSIVLLLLIKATIGLRVEANDEQQGLDISQHGEEGYVLT
ncbi:MAG: ammonium transporter [Pirellulaceae bacterium]